MAEDRRALRQLGAALDRRLGEPTALLRELAAEGCIVIASGPDGAPRENGPLSAVTTIQIDGDVLLRVSQETLDNPALWRAHQNDVARRLRPLTALRDWIGVTSRWTGRGGVLFGFTGSLLTAWPYLRQISGGEGTLASILLSRGTWNLVLAAVAVVALPILGLTARRRAPAWVFRLVRSWLLPRI